jgi:hypothetical protein
MTAITVRLYLIQVHPDDADPDAWFTEGEAWTADAALRWSSLLEAGGITVRLVTVDLAGRLVGEPTSPLAVVGEQEDEQAAEQHRSEPLGRLISTHRGRSPFGQPEPTEQPDEPAAEQTEPDTGSAAPHGPLSAPATDPGTDTP